MRICLLAATYPLVTETFVYQPVDWLIERGHDVAVVARRAGSLPRAGGEASPLRVAPRVPTPAREVLALLRNPARAPQRLAAARALGQARPVGPLRVAARSLLPEIAHADALLAHFGRVGVRWLPVAAVAGRPYAVCFHGNDATGELYPGRYDDLFRSGAGMITNSRFLAARLEAAGADAARIAVIPNGVADALLAEEQPLLASCTVVTVGRLVEKKGIADSVAAFLRARAALPGWRYDIVGDGPLRSELESAARAGGGDRTVRFRGVLQHARALAAIRAASMLVLASRTAVSGDSEGTPNCVLEAAALGVPVVATQHAGIPEILPADASARGFLVPEGDVAGLAHAIGRLGADAALRREWGEACRAHVRRRHTADAHVAALVGALERVARVPAL